MLHYLGRGLSGLRSTTAVQTITPPVSSSAKLFDFMLGSLPLEFNYTRSDSAATIRNASGKLVAVPANTPRFDHDEAGNALGLRIEPLSTNKCTNTNVNPTDTSGFTKGGDANSTISVVDAPVGLLEAADLEQLCTNGKVFYLDNSAGSSNAYVDIAGETGNTNIHSASVYAAAAVAGYNGTFTVIGTTGFVAINNSQMTRLVHENVIPNHPTRKIRLTVLAGKGAYFILNQLEEMPFVTSPIIVQGAAATRQREVCLATGLDSADWFNNAAGAMVGECVFDHPDGFDLQYAFLATEGQGLSNTLGMNLSISDSSQVRATDISNGSLQQFDDVHAPIAGRRMPLAISWNESESYGIAGPMRFNKATRVPQTNAMTNLYIGGRPFNNAMSGWVRFLKVYNTFKTVEQLGVDMIPANARAVMSGGQSNKHGFFRSQVGQFNTGEKNAIAQMDTYWSANENWLINGAMNGSHAIKQNDANADNASANWWYDPITDTFGPRMAYWEEIARAFGVNKIDAFDWDQGESDSVSSVADLKVAWLAIFNQMRSVVGDRPVIITPIGRRSDAQTVAYNNIRQAQQELVAENSWIHLAPEKFIRPLADTVHLTDEGYGEHSIVLLRKIMSVLGESVSGGVDGPEVLSASRSGTAVTVTLSHNAGSDFTPAASIAGFHFRNNNAVVAVTGAARVNATQISLTLDSAPNGSGEEILYYGYGTLFDESATYTDLVRDNSTYALPLRATEIVL